MSNVKTVRVFDTVGRRAKIAGGPRIAVGNYQLKRDRRVGHGDSKHVLPSRRDTGRNRMTHISLRELRSCVSPTNSLLAFFFRVNVPIKTIRAWSVSTFKRGSAPVIRPKYVAKSVAACLTRAKSKRATTPCCPAGANPLPFPSKRTEERSGLATKVAEIDLGRNTKARQHPISSFGFETKRRKFRIWCDALIFLSISIAPLRTGSDTIILSCQIAHLSTYWLTNYRFPQRSRTYRSQLSSLGPIPNSGSEMFGRGNFKRFMQYREIDTRVVAHLS